MHTKSLTVFTIAMLATLAGAQEVTREAKIERLLALTRADAVIDQIKAGLTTQMPSTGTPGQNAKAREFQARFLDLLKSRLNADSARREMVKIYSETFSDEEIDGMLAFYESPAGQATLQKMPQLMGKTIAWAQAQASEILRDVEKSNKEAERKTVGQKAADFKLKDLSGREVQLSSFQGKVVLLDFWATWCAPCRAEMPIIEKLGRENPDLVVLGIDVGEEADVVQKFVNDNGITYPILLAGHDLIVNDYDAKAMPTVVLVGKNGIIHSHITGYGPQVEEHLKTALADALKAESLLASAVSDRH